MASSPFCFPVIVYPTRNQSSPKQNPTTLYLVALVDFLGYRMKCQHLGLAQVTSPMLLYIVHSVTPKIIFLSRLCPKAEAITSSQNF